MGFAPAKTGTKDVATKQAAVAQMKATREARHTMGRKQKAGIKGVVLPPSAPAAPATNPAPAPAVATAPTAPAVTNGSSTH